jgi:hypothetical protein
MLLLLGKLEVFYPAIVEIFCFTWNIDQLFAAC